jgi:hypothetical protein
MAAPAAALCGSCIAVRKPSADGANWLEGLLGALCAVELWMLGAVTPWAPDAPPAGKLCPVEKALAAEVAEFADNGEWRGSRDSRAADTAEVFEVVGLIIAVASAGTSRTIRAAPSRGAPQT